MLNNPTPTPTTGRSTGARKIAAGMAAARLIAAPAASATVYHGSMDLSPAVNGITHMDASPW